MSDENKKVITISREFGSGGRLIGRRLSEKLGVPYYDKELLDKIAEESGFSREMIEGAEKRAKNSFLYSLASAMGTGESGPESLSLNERFFLAQFDTIRRLAEEEESCVIVGRCADYALAGNPGLLSVFIHGNTDDRVRRLMKLYDLKENKARELILKTDKKRSSYYNYYTDKRWGSAFSYDLCLNSSAFGLEGCAEAIMHAAEAKGIL